MKMTSFKTAMASVILVLVMVGCDDRDGPAEEAGEAIDNTMDNIGDSFDDAADSVGDAAEDAKDAKDEIEDATN